MEDGKSRIFSLRNINLTIIKIATTNGRIAISKILPVFLRRAGKKKTSLLLFIIPKTRANKTTANNYPHIKCVSPE